MRITAETQLKTAVRVTGIREIQVLFLVACTELYFSQVHFKQSVD